MKECGNAYDVIIIGAGAAGLSAAIYAKRYGLSTLVLEQNISGGAAAEAPMIENYPGFISISGMDLTEKMKEHAKAYAEIKEVTAVTGIEKNGSGFTLIAGKDRYEARSVILATGAGHKKLNAKGESEFIGKGVSYCATCDGFFFRDKKVAVIGGGNTAAIEAMHLKKLGCDVLMVHRRGELRAEKALQEKLFDSGVAVVWNSVLEEIRGDAKVKAIKVKNTKTGSISEIAVEGVFIAVGEAPRNELAKQLGAACDEAGSVIVDKAQRSSVAKFYAAGDITGGLRQVITACAEGAVAANSAQEDLR
jgi:thioredoxin reductase (NADPH)